ncbi:hypothetical protein QOZ80_1AG0031980 [Eleusine coracana subsp. coracana]|nr:hypothetical protein QOZ80_1AG0031980 [Eleusine coracana subsp. coracana]
MANASTIVLPLLLILFSPAAMSSALAPAGAEESSPDIYVVFVSRADYIDSVDYDLRLLAPVVGSVKEAKEALLYHYGGIGFAARLASKHADQLSKKEGIAVLKDKMYHVQDNA